MLIPLTLKIPLRQQVLEKAKMKEEAAKAEFDDSDVGFATMLVLDEIIHQLIKANLLDSKAMQASIANCTREFSEDSDAGLRRVLTVYAESIGRASAK